MVLAVILLTTATAWAGTGRLIYSGGSGDIDDPYQIKTPEDLVTLATNVNSGTTYEGVYFKVMNNINFSEASTTSLRPTAAWNAAGSTESNFSPIGSRNGNTIHKFQGHFDGNGCTISGIRIYNAGSSANNGGHQGLFGYIGDGAEVKAVTLSNARITGHRFCGGIVGRNEANTTVSNCHVTNTVAIHTAMDNVDDHGGIIGFNYSGTVKECTSAATLSFASTNHTGCENYGGIVGFNNGTLTDNIANGATVPAASNENKHGAIAGDGYTTAMQRNYYLNCNVAGTANATGIGMKGADATVNNAAVSIHTLTLNDPITTTTAPSVNISGTGYYAQGTVLALNNGQSAAPTGYIYSYTVNGESVTTTDNTVTMPATDATIGLGSLVAIPWTGSGTSDDPYIILYPSQLDLLATNVNNDDGHFYYNTYFKLGDDIAYDYDTAWDDATSYASNFTPIGTNNTNFRGHFDGNGKTISGIRVYAPTTNDIAIFRTIDSQAEVKGITLDDTRLTGQNVVAGIVARTGTNNGTGTVTGCTVTNRVAIHITATNGSNYGGIVAVNNHGTVSHCVSSIQMTIADGVTPRYCGGIVGNNSDALTDNFVIGALIPEARNSAHAAIAVNAYNTNSYSYAHNYYHNCTVAGTANATGVGVCTMVNETTTTIADITENNGAVSLHTLTLADGISTTTTPTITIGGTPYFLAGTTITLSGTQTGTPPVGYIYGDSYAVNGTTISGSTFDMPAQDTEVTTTIIPVYPLTLADGITTTTTPAITIGGTPYFLAGTTITLSGTQTGTPPVGYIYDGYAVNGTAISGNTFTMPAQDTEVTSTTKPVYTLTLADGITTTTTPTITFGDTPYYLAGTTITLSGTQTNTPPVGYIYDGYAVNGTAISGNTFTMPAQDTEVTSTTKPVYTLTLADGITTTTTPTITFGDTPYYLAGTTITLSGGLPDVSATSEFAFYTVNGEEIIGSSFTMPAEAVTVGTDILVFTEWTGDGTKSSPYLIQSCEDLMLLARRVNNDMVDAYGNQYSYQWYKLDADIQFKYANLGETESNFETIGNDNYHFHGHFLGNGHTISGIRIRQKSKDNIGLFNYINYAEISGVILADADITGKDRTGGIVGENGGTVTDCHVTSTVIIRATADGTKSHGGIVGENVEGSTVSGCTSAATLTIENGATYCSNYGGIAGYNNRGTLCDNMALGVHLPNIGTIGAIIGYNFQGTLLRNYYSGCTKEGGGSVKGCSGQDVTDNDGAVPGIALYDHSVFSGLNSQTLQTDIHNYYGNFHIALLGRTLYKDGRWNTLCLPFNVNNLSNTPLAGATVMELNIGDKWKMEDGQWIIDNENGTYQTGLDGTTLHLYFKPATSIVARRPYIVKWETTGEPLENPVFQNVIINNTEPATVTSHDGKVQFKGIYDPTQLPNDDGSNLCFGTENLLYWPSADETLNAFRAYLHVDGTVQAIQSNVLFALMGDVNGNGGIDIGDAVCIVNYLVNKNNTVFKDQLADLNGNGGIDIGDAVMIVNILVGKTNSSQTTGKGLQTTEEGLQTTDDHEPQ